MRGAIWMELRADYQKGLSYSELGRKYNIDRRTAKRYAQSESRPVYSLTDSKPSMLDPYKEQILFWLEEAPYSALRIWEKLREQGFGGGYSIVKQYVRGRKEQLNEQATVRFETIPGFSAQPKRRTMSATGHAQHLASRDKWTGRFSRTLKSSKTAKKRSCTAF